MEADPRGRGRGRGRVRADVGVEAGAVAADDGQVVRQVAAWLGLRLRVGCGWSWG